MDEKEDLAIKADFWHHIQLTLVQFIYLPVIVLFLFFYIQIVTIFLGVVYKISDIQRSKNIFVYLRDIIIFQKKNIKFKFV